MPKQNSDYPRFVVRVGVYDTNTKEWPVSIADTYQMGPHPYPHQHLLVAACNSKQSAELIAALLNQHFKE